METQRDLALAYSPGVAAPCEAIVADPEAARDYTARGNLVGIVLLYFPYIFHGTPECHATDINEAMEMAAVSAALARAEPDKAVDNA